MTLPTFKRTSRFGRLGLLSGVFLLLGGCPVDTDKLATDVLQAVLTSITNSLVDALSKFLAAN